MRRTALTIVGLMAGCAPTYAPPLQTVHGGAPARVREGDVAVMGGMVHGPAMGGPSVSYGVRDSVAVEAGANVSAGDWAMGFAGVRYTHAPRRFAKNYLAVDVHGAGGAGVGGQLRGNQPVEDGGDGRSWSDRVAGGGAAGAGVAGHFSFFSVYARGRGQLTKATAVPSTLWVDGGLGVQFRLFRTLDLFAQATWFVYRNRVETFYNAVPLGEVGLAVRIPTWRYRRR